MASEKTKKDLPAVLHAITYSLPFLFLSTSWQPLAVIIVTHYLIDRFRLVRFLNWIKNFMGPPTTKETVVTEKSKTYRNFYWWQAWKHCTATGYPSDKPAWLAVWLMIIADNTIHILINGLALGYL